MNIGDWFSETAFSGSLLLAVPVAIVAGLVSFFSPCVVPLLPGYLSYTTGLSGAEQEAARRGRHHEEIRGHDLPDVVGQERAPRL